jgi:hypothetical protein
MPFLLIKQTIIETKYAFYYSLRNGRLKGWLWSGHISYSGGCNISYLHHNIQTGSGAQPDSYSMGNKGPFARGETAISHPLVPRLRMHGALPPLSPYAFNVW